MDALWSLDTCALSDLLAKGEITAEALVRLSHGRIAQLNPDVNAVIYLDPAAIDAAKASDARRKAGTPRSPLDGIPMLIKDNLMAKGMPTTWGSPLFADQIATQDEIPVARLRRAGVIFLGKTNVPEFTVEGVTQNPIFGVTRNPWDTEKTPGGSSGGSVAAVALGFSPCSVGTDGGGSVRRPASYTNLVGLKTSIGLIPRGEGLPQLLLDMETIGPITRTVRDQALLLDALAGPDPRDHRSLRHGARPAHEAGFMAALNQPVAPLRILAVSGIGAAPVDPAITERFGEMVAFMTSLGHAVTVGPMPFDVQPVYDLWTTIADIGLALLLQNVPEMAEKASSKYVEWARKDYPATHLLEVIEAIGTLRNQAALAFSDAEDPAGGTGNTAHTGNTGFDIIMTPSSAAMPWSTDLPFPPEIDGVAAGPRGSALFSGWVNACGHPAISLPAPRAASGLPIGVQFTANLGQDALLLQLAQQVEWALPWRDDWPPLATHQGLET